MAGGLAPGAKEEGPSAGAGQGHIEKAPLFSVGIGLRLRDDEVEQLVIFDPARNAVVAFADVEQDRVVRFQALGAMEGKARDLDVREPRYLSAEGIQQVITTQDEDFPLVCLPCAPLTGDTLPERA